MNQPVVLCPLQIERRAVAREIKLRARVVCTGPGADAVAAAVEELKPLKPSLVILCGLAGGLAPTTRVPPIDRVTDSNARLWKAPVVAPGEGPAVGVIGVDEPVTHPARKQQMATAFGVQLVDCESHGFARAAHAAGLRWAVVRAVSDGPDDRLPESAGSWIDEKGKTRIGQVILQTVLEPSVLWSVVRLGLRSKPAMRAAAAVVRELLDREKQAAADPFGDSSRALAGRRAAPRTGQGVPGPAGAKGAT